ncbi:TPA: hypothetical protein JBF89_13335 [Legionella pneumophila]|nr:hypothetical protein [Legionella pneumophila]HAU0349948.1 hypothetical protein [Legionella pneumophila]HAU0353439.1 hypothetical protein [Legionella pneumophila]HAU0359528.1 hypothetical protein [Legionella pneumophila]HAU0368085.1 hypothetical protein [Legionella pneumophila]
MKRIFQKEVLKNVLKKIVRFAIRLNDAFWEPPRGWVEYRKAIIEKDQDFNFMENEYFKRHIYPHLKGRISMEQMKLGTADSHHLFNKSHEIFKVNPSTGLPMLGAYDSSGNPFGFNYNQAFHSHINSSSHFSNTFSNTSYNSFDYWR